MLITVPPNQWCLQVPAGLRRQHSCSQAPFRISFHPELVLHRADVRVVVLLCRSALGVSQRCCFLWAAHTVFSLGFLQEVGGARGSIGTITGPWLALQHCWALGCAGPQAGGRLVEEVLVLRFLGVKGSGSELTLLGWVPGFVARDNTAIAQLAFVLGNGSLFLCIDSDCKQWAV